MIKSLPASQQVRAHTGKSVQAGTTVIVPDGTYGTYGTTVLAGTYGTMESLLWPVAHTCYSPPDRDRARARDPIIMKTKFPPLCTCHRLPL